MYFKFHHRIEQQGFIGVQCVQGVWQLQYIQLNGVEVKSYPEYFQQNNLDFCVLFMAVSSPFIIHSSDESRIPGFSHHACMPRSLWAKRLEVVCGERGRTLFKQPWNSRKRRRRKRRYAGEERGTGTKQKVELG